MKCWLYWKNKKIMKSSL